MHFNHNCYYEKIGKNEPVKLEDLPFDIPENWTWVRLKSLFEIRNGFTPLRSEAKYWEKGTINWFTVEDIHNQGHIITSTVVKINKCACTEDRIVPASSLLLCCTASIGEYALTTIPLTTNQQFNGLSLNEYSRSAFNISYLLAIAPWFKSILLKLAGTTTFPFVSTKKLENVAIPLPPINEQTRIVNKINSFEPLIAKYSLTEEKLTKLEQEFPEKLKKSILQYAIEGKLVKQDPNDEPASVLLERIKAEKEKLIKEGKIKRDKNESYIYQGDDKNYYEKINCKAIFFEVPFTIPDTWIWVKAKTLLKNLQYGFNGCGLSEGKVKMLRITDIQNNSVNWDTLPYCSMPENAVSDYQIATNDIFIARTGGTIGKSFHLKEQIINTVFAGYLIRFQFIKEEISDYISLFLNSPLYWSQVADKQAGTGQPNINGISLGNLLIPIPPINEQMKIQEKISRLFDVISF